MTDGTVTSGSQVSAATQTAWSHSVANAKNNALENGDILGAKHNFEAHFNAKLGAMLAEVATENDADRILLENLAVETLEEISKLTFKEGEKPKLSDFRGMLIEADKRGNALLEEVNVRSKILAAGTADERPQLVPCRKENGEAGINLIRRAPNLENLVLRGGGAKGVGLPTTLMELKQAGMLGNIQHFAGSSAGAMTASMLAAGISPEKVDELLSETPPKVLTSTDANFHEHYPMYQGVKRTGMQTGGNIMKMIDQELTKSVVNYLQQEHPDRASLADPQLGLSEKDIGRLESLRDQDLDTCFDADRSGRMITFRDLHLMNKLNPDKFKELTLTGCDRATKETFYFDAKSQPNLEIALAARISAGLPPIFQAVSLDLGSVYGVRTLIDGGISSNMPDEAIFGNVPKGEEVDPNLRAKTAVVGFADDANGDEAYRIMHGIKPPKPPGVLQSSSVKGAAGAIGRKITSTATAGLFKLVVPQSTPQALKKDENSLHNAGPNAFVSFHGELSTTSFSATQAQIFDAKTHARVKILEQIEVRTHQAYAVEVNSVEDAAKLLTESEKAAILAKDRPVGDKTTDLDRELFDLLKLEADVEQLFGQPVNVAGSDTDSVAV